MVGTDILEKKLQSSLPVFGLKLEIAAHINIAQTFSKSTNLNGFLEMKKTMLG
jgi:hypothetical protein